MRIRKLLYGFLAGALLLASAAPSAKAAPKAGLEEGRTAYFTFDDGTLKDSQGGESAAAVVTGLGSYGGEIQYESGKNGKAVRLGDYGLQLNRKDLGEEFTVALWLKPDGAFADNQSVLFLGYHAPEKWMAVAGNGENSSNCKFWANGEGYEWSIIGNADMGAGDWHFLALTGSESGVSAYLDGNKIGETAGNRPLSGANQDIYLGVTYWDPEFAGLADEIMVYDRALSEGELDLLYRDMTPEELLEEEGISVPSSLKLPAGRSQKLELTIPAAVEEAGAQIEYNSSDEAVVTVDAQGMLTAVAEGSADITVKASLGGVTKEAVTQITVAGALESNMTASYSFEGSLENNADPDGAEASPMYFNNGIQEYTGEVRYAEDGKEGQALELDGYGVRLNQNALGESYTVSLWFKPDTSLVENQILLFMGDYAPENWLAVSGSTTEFYKIWANGGIYGTHTTLFSPSVDTGEWSQLTLTGEQGKVTAYLNGIRLGTADSNDPLIGEASDIYLGVNNWDEEFDGLIDEVRVYSLAMTEEEVQAQAKEEFEGMLQEKLARELPVASILGENERAGKICYDLELPSAVSGMKVSWTSSHPDIISADGKVATPAQDQEVTLTAQLEAGTLQASQTYTLTAVALDRTALDELLRVAEAVDTSNVIDLSRERLEQAVAAAKEAKTFAEIDQAYENLNRAISQLCYLEDYREPFALLSAPAVKTSVYAGEKQELFAIPDQVRDAVDVEYVSEKQDLALYADGTVAGLQPGKTVVTAVVTSKYDGWKMEYSTAVEVLAAQSGEEPGEGPETPDPGEQKPDAGTDGNAGSGNAGSSGSSGGSGSEAQKTAGAATGDRTNIWLPVMGILLAGGIGAFCFRRYRKWDQK